MSLVRFFAVLLITAILGVAQPVGSLKQVTLPERSNLNQYVQDQAALVVLGKALFWDMQAGSDGRLACASCHFHAGADHRIQNQLSNFSSGMSPNAVLTESDFPFHLLSDLNNNRSAVVRDTAAVSGSAGILRRMLTAIIPSNPSEAGYDLYDAPAFTLNGINTRQVTTRNAPSVINAVFNFRNFWDGRASDIFTGATPFGAADTGLHALNVSSSMPVAEAVAVTNSSLASQAVAPALNAGEMSYEGRVWAQIGKKMLSLQPLALQRVAPDDSVLGKYAVAGGRGLQIASYQALVEAAFAPAYWNSSQLVDGEFTVAQYNFGLFWGLAIQAYESTLIADDSRVDQFFDGNRSALTAQEQRGLQLFQGRGDCTNCHAGAETTLASFSAVAQNRGGPGPGRGPLPDRGFFRTGVRPISDDVGLGGMDAFGNPLSRAVLNGLPPAIVQGLFKAPALRNVEFTGPYQHNGGQSTLEQVIAFYSRGGDFPQDGNLGPGIGRKNLSQADRDAIVAFLKALSDDRVRYERAPFDHPELCVPVGEQSTDSLSVTLDTSNPMFQFSAADKWAGLPEVGQGGNQAPLQTFTELLQGVGKDGSRSHTLQDACSIPSTR